MELAQAGHKTLAIQLNKEAWDLLERQNRTEAESLRLIHAAHASLYHWLHAGTPVHEQRGEWLVARVYAVLGDGESALRHARRCQMLTEQHKSEMKDFDIAYAAEALARAYNLLHHPDAKEWSQTARNQGDQIKDPEDKKIFDADFAT